ncbi:hypothetical protein HM1_0967 [Heliomicrobium modesticaldum Ice1]|uniref:Uncharacterized protein n=1 Tax=Heliobacterium modesticaldum (strain ATCC 51547 / Ice1) TaxID=498761 RepID=B0TA62_HELMI|nr:hypothetical protein [Heliomicrobium modesticaldum]ABZ83599.1 hypothetical protein HM1_0967 [Heliomicrobium modesticaldum Ice1]
MADEEISPFDEAVNIDSLSLADLEADLLRLQAQPTEAEGPAEVALDGAALSEGGAISALPGGDVGSSPEAVAANAKAATKGVSPFAGLAATMGQATANRWVVYGLAFLLLLPLSVGLIWGLNRAWDRYMTPPETYPPKRLVDYAQAAKVVRLHMQGGFARLGQAITLNDEHLVEEALTDSSPRRHDVEQAIRKWQGFFSQYRQFEKPTFDIRVFLVRDVKIEPAQDIVEAVADVSTFSSYEVNNRRLERSVDYELWVRLVYRDGHWRLDDYRNVGEGTAGHAGARQSAGNHAAAATLPIGGPSLSNTPMAGFKVGSDMDRFAQTLFPGASRSDTVNGVAVAPTRPASRLLGLLPADLSGSL